MRPYYVVCRRDEAAAEATPDQLLNLSARECDECHAAVMAATVPHDPIVVCRECFPWSECVGVMTPPDVTIDALVLGQLAGDTWRQPSTGEASAIWVNCPRCRAHRGDPCRGVSYCAERLGANLQRMLDLPTFGVPRQTPCCRASVWLCWRTARDAMTFVDVPCTECGKTYTFNVYQSDFAPGDRHRIDRLNGHIMEMTCWALE